ncbi:MAG: hypothetical protein H6834_03565 [Planctomycetes bacterium]|nr:hypothetical protein [Planctomycetota bacterium]
MRATFIRTILSTLIGWADRYFATWIGVLVAVLFLVAVPQASNVLWQLPTGGPWWVRWGYPTFLVLVFTLDGVLLWWAVPREGDRIWAKRSIPAALALLTCGTVLWFLPEYAWGPDRSTIAAAAVAAWCFGAWIGWPLGARATHNSAAVHRLCGRMLTAYWVSILVGELLWYGISISGGALSNRNYSVWALFEITLVILLVARLLDELQARVRKGPLRLGAMVVAFVVLALSGHSSIGRARSNDATVRATRWLDQVEKRLAAIPDGPVLLVSASGGGSRAALFASMVLESLQRTPTGVEPGEGGRVPTLADHVLLVSSVSGGSLATAWFVTKNSMEVVPGHRQTTGLDLAARMRDVAALSAARGSGDARAKILDALSERCTQLFEAMSADAALPNLPIPFRSAFADAMSTDFVAPLLRGALLPGVDRDRSLVDAWNRQFGWRDVSNESAYDASRPIVLFNAALSKEGRGFAIGFPRTSDPLNGPALVTFDQEHPDRSLSLAEMVRLSAGFPWLTPVAVVASENGTTSHVVDGGIVDNTGMETLARVTRRLVEVGEWSEGDGPAKQQAARVLASIRARGVVIVEIDSGAKKLKLGASAQLFPALFEPVDALQIALDRNARRARDRAISELRTLLMNRAEPGKLAGGWPMSVRFSCDQFEDVMTSWSLGPRDKASIWTTFLFEYESVMPDLLEAFHMQRRFASFRIATQKPAVGRMPTMEEIVESASEVQASIDERNTARDVVREAFGGRVRDSASDENATAASALQRAVTGGLAIAAVCNRPQSGHAADQQVWLVNETDTTLSPAGWTLEFEAEGQAKVVWPLTAADGPALPGLWTSVHGRSSRPAIPSGNVVHVTIRSPGGEVSGQGEVPVVDVGRVHLLRPLPGIRELLEGRKR